MRRPCTSIKTMAQLFTASLLPCECCGEPCDALTYNENCECLTGTNCSCMIEDEPITCPGLAAIYADDLPRSIGELNAQIAEHVRTCYQCSSPRKKVASETLRAPQDERRTA